ISKLLAGLNKLNFKISDACLAEEKDNLYQIFRIQDGVENFDRPIDLIISPLYKQNNDPLLSKLLNREILKTKNKLDGLKKSANVDECEISSTKKLLEELENYEN
ncbi:MAG: tRNA (adenine(22)-N(1))-methyltransferase TrmK, partial [Clostridia bacterium]|nr:tRNA (adenine(22)-N(1))-methyltransferase TrmK [Clostridia bacterium]